MWWNGYSSHLHEDQNSFELDRGRDFSFRLASFEQKCCQLDVSDVCGGCSMHQNIVTTYALYTTHRIVQVKKTLSTEKVLLVESRRVTSRRSKCLFSNASFLHSWAGSVTQSSAQQPTCLTAGRPASPRTARAACPPQMQEECKTIIGALNADLPT